MAPQNPTWLCRWARALAEAARGSIWLLRVARDPAWPDTHADLHAAADSIDRIAAELANSGREVHPVIREGDPAQEILHLSQDMHADVIPSRSRASQSNHRSEDSLDHELTSAALR